jgi:hypothetical protein
LLCADLPASLAPQNNPTVIGAAVPPEAEVKTAYGRLVEFLKKNLAA